jgi:cob(I)alamin adenosyltransferase
MTDMNTNKTERPPGYVARCSLRGAGSSADPDDAPIERPLPLIRNTAAGIDVPHTPEDRGTAEPRRRKPRDRPLLVVVTGEGKGKSTSAFGMLLRSWNRDYRCGVVQFIKSGKWKVGEQRAAEALGGIDWFKTGDGWSWISKDLTESADLARAGWEQVKTFINEERYEFLLLDDFTYPMKWGWVDVADVVDTLANRPGFQHVVITGRDAPPALIEAADLVSEVTLVKHQMAQGIRGQQGIEW